MPTVKAEILNTGIPKLKSAAIEIESPIDKVFSLIASPKNHPLIDGSNSVKAVNWGPNRLSLGAKFGMKMKIGIPYRITNTVTEFSENKVIAWRHLGRWVWRYELIEIGRDRVRVVESFDGRPSPFQWWLNARGAYAYVEKAMAKSLVRLKAIAEQNN
jgi:hypothetical protein